MEEYDEMNHIIVDDEGAHSLRVNGTAFVRADIEAERFGKPENYMHCLCSLCKVNHFTAGGMLYVSHGDVIQITEAAKLM